MNNVALIAEGEKLRGSFRRWWDTRFTREPASSWGGTRRWILRNHGILFLNLRILWISGGGIQNTKKRPKGAILLFYSQTCPSWTKFEPFSRKTLTLKSDSHRAVAILHCSFNESESA
jgi:hypothetical protein